MRCVLLASLLLLAGCALPEPTLNALPRPRQDPPGLALALRGKALKMAHDARLDVICTEDATLAALHARQDVAEQVVAMYTAEDGNGLPTAAKIIHVFADNGALVFLYCEARWTNGEWKEWALGGLVRHEPPSMRAQKERAAW